MKIYRFLLVSALASSISFAHAQEGENKPAAEPQTEQTAEQKPEEPAQEKTEPAAEEKPAEEKPAEEAKPEEPAAAEATPGSVESSQAEVVLEGLNNPSGLAIQPETGIVFVADSGNHQVVKVVDGKAEPVITDFPHDVYGKGPKVNIGPLGLLFLDKNTLVVGGGGLPDGEELLRVYELPADGSAIKAETMKASFNLPEDGETKGEGNFYALAATAEGIYVTCNGDDTKGWVSRASRNGTEVTDYARFLATKEATEVDAPVGITVSPQGGYLVVGQMGEINVAGDSLITFYDSSSKKMLLNLKTGLHDITSVAYSARKQMYVLDYAWMDTTQGGLFQILEDKSTDTGIRTKKIMSLDKPTAMAFDSEGALYITVIGVAEDANSKGMLLKIPADIHL